MTDNSFVSAYDYVLPEHLIAQKPIPNRTASRLLCVDVDAQTIAHESFSALPDYLKPGDVLVLNDTQVLRARLYAKRATGAKIEVLLLAAVGEHVWEAFIRPAKRIAEGEYLQLPQGRLQVLKKNIDTTGKATKHLVRLESQLSDLDLIAQCGQIPLPPYVRTTDANAFESAYQTVVAKVPGAVAAPTAGLHFTQELLDHIRSRGVTVCTVTLHVGYGTFQPMATSRLEDHEMHEERYMISDDTAACLTQALQEKRRIIAVGTTVMRTLESACHNRRFSPGSGTTCLFIRPGYRFVSVSGLITNFHLPCSTLLVLVCTFGGDVLIKQAYDLAIASSYRFFSFGDAMLILRPEISRAG